MRATPEPASAAEKETTTADACHAPSIPVAVVTGASVSTAPQASRRPPVTHVPARLATGSALASTRAIRSATVSPGWRAAHRATVPVTCGAAMEVPFLKA